MYGILYIQKVVLRSHYMRTETAIAPIKGLFYYHGEIMYKDSKLSFYQVDIKYKNESCKTNMSLIKKGIHYGCLFIMIL